MQERDRNNKCNSQECCGRSRIARDDLQHFLKSKRGYSAKGSTLLPLALRPRLASAGRNYIASIIKPRLDSVGRNHTRPRLTSIGVVAIAILGGIYGRASNAFAAPSVTLTLPEDVSVDVNPTSNGGFAVGANSQVNVINSNLSGFTLGIKAKNDSNDLVNETNKDSKLSSITEELTEDEYKNGKDGNNFTNTWAFKPDVVNSLANTSFLPGPTTDGLLLARTIKNNLAGETFNFAVAAKVDGTAAAGKYSNDFILTATGNGYHYSIDFDPNGGTGGPADIPETEVTSSEILISGDIPTLEGKDFLGWCSRKPDEDGSCAGIVAQPGKYFPLCECNLDVTLYAMWGTKATGGGGNGFGGIWSEDFSGVPDGTSCGHNGYEGKVYNEKCWMSSDFRTDRNWTQANIDCAVVGWALPSKTDFDNLVSKIGNGAELYGLGWVNNYWSSTMSEIGRAYFLHVTGNSAGVYSDHIEGSWYYVGSIFNVRCVSD